MVSCFNTRPTAVAAAEVAVAVVGVAVAAPGALLEFEQYEQ